MAKAVENPKKHIVSFRIDSAGRDAIDAARGGKSVSEYVLGLINKAQSDGGAR